MSIYQICDGCTDKPFCNARHNPYDELCSKHEQFIEKAKMNHNSQFYRPRYAER